MKSEKEKMERMRTKSDELILDSLSPKFGRPLSWTHYRILLQEISPGARAWYAKEA